MVTYLEKCKISLMSVLLKVTIITFLYLTLIRFKDIFYSLINEEINGNELEARSRF